MNILRHILLIALLAGPVAAADLDLQEIFQTSEFKARFAASYGVKSSVEPTISQEEKQLLDEVAGILSTNLPAATLRLLENLQTNSSAALDFTLGNFLFQQNKLDDAARQYGVALLKMPDFLRAHKNLALIQFQQAEYQNSLASLLKSLALGEVDELTFGLVGHCHFRLGHHASAESAYRRALIFNPANANWKQGLASTLIEQNRHAEAAAWLEELLVLKPDRADLWLAQADTYLGREDVERAAANYELLRRMGKASPGSLLNLGDIYVNQGLPRTAVDTYLEALTKKPLPDLPRMLRVARIILEQQRPQESSRLVTALEKSYATKSDDLLRLKSRIAFSQGDSQAAVNALESLVEQNPTDGETLILLGDHYAASTDKKQQERAALLYERASRVEGFAARAMVQQAVMLVRRNQFEKAILILKNAQAIDPKPNVADYLERLERIFSISGK
ncbi:MAG: tetratricopeptide repeat protein [Limisphaerales bacterium]